MNAVTRILVDRIVKSGMTGSNVLATVNAVLNNAKRGDWLVELSPDDAQKKIIRDLSNWKDKKLVKVMTFFLMNTVMKKMSVREWEQIADAVDNQIENERVAFEKTVASELAKVAHLLAR